MTLYAYPMSSNVALPSQQPPYQFQTQPSHPSQQFIQSTPRPYIYTDPTQTQPPMVKQEDAEQQQQQQHQSQPQPQQPTQLPNQQQLQPQPQPQYLQPTSNAMTFQPNPYPYGFPPPNTIPHQAHLSYDMSAAQPPYMGFAPPPPPRLHSGLHGGIPMAAAAQFPSMINQIATNPDSLGQKPPPGIKPRVTTTMWEDEGTLCFQVEAKGFCVARREDNNMINGTKLLNVAGMTRGRRDGILKSEKVRHVVKIGTMYLKGVWIPYERALEFSQREQIVDILYPLFVADIRSFLYHPVNYTRTIQVLAAAERKKQADHYRLQQAAAQAAQQHQLALPAPPALSQQPNPARANPTQSEMNEAAATSASANATPTSLAPPAFPGNSPVSATKSPIDQKPFQTPPVAGQPQMWIPMHGNYYSTTQPSPSSNLNNPVTTAQPVPAATSTTTTSVLPSLSYQGSVAAQPYMYTSKTMTPQNHQIPSPSNSNPPPSGAAPPLYSQFPPPQNPLQPSPGVQQPMQPVAPHSSTSATFPPVNQPVQEQPSESGTQTMTSAMPPVVSKEYGKGAEARSPHTLLPPPAPPQSFPR